MYYKNCIFLSLFMRGIDSVAHIRHIKTPAPASEYCTTQHQASQICIVIPTKSSKRQIKSAWKTPILLEG